MHQGCEDQALGEEAKIKADVRRQSLQEPRPVFQCCVKEIKLVTVYIVSNCQMPG